MIINVQRDALTTLTQSQRNSWSAIWKSWAWNVKIWKQDVNTKWNMSMWRLITKSAITSKSTARIKAVKRKDFKLISRFMKIPVSWRLRNALGAKRYWLLKQSPTIIALLLWTVDWRWLSQWSENCVNWKRSRDLNPTMTSWGLWGLWSLELFGSLKLLSTTFQ